MEQYSSHVSQCFRGHLHTSQLLAFSSKLQQQFREKLKASEVCMLPSYTYGMPTGNERGQYLSLDVGGSTLRIALVSLNGRSTGANEHYGIRQRAFKINDAVKMLPGRLFFDWVAKAIHEFLGVEGRRAVRGNRSMPLGVAWSFPVEQLSLRDALLIQMGKAFRVTDTLLGYNLADLIEASCRQLDLAITVEAIVNDSSAILLAQTYCKGAAGIAYILGTGMNAAIELPSQAFGPSKFITRSSTAGTVKQPASKVVVNAELSMFGGNVFPLTSWDSQMRAQHPRPDFQPLEHFASGRDIGEIVRFTLLEAIQKSYLFGGEIPARFGPYELETSSISGLESDDPSLFEKTVADFKIRHALPNNRTYSDRDILHIRGIIEHISDRAAAYVATSMHALWSLVLNSEHDGHRDSKEQVIVSCNGSVLVKYPKFKERVQRFLDLMTGRIGKGPQALMLQIAGKEENVLIGAAVAVAAGRSTLDRSAAKIRARL